MSERSRLNDLGHSLFRMASDFEDKFCEHAIEIGMSDEDAEAYAKYFDRFEDGSGAIFKNLLRRVPAERRKRVMLDRWVKVAEAGLIPDHGASGPEMEELAKKILDKLGEE